MKLKHITFTGIDAQTDLHRLRGIQQQFPLAEFGVLTSYHWYENGNRYIDPLFLRCLWDQKLNLSLHICGSAAHDAAIGLWNAIDRHLNFNLRLFKRVQLNIANRDDNPRPLASTPDDYTELIIQQKDVHNTSLFYRTAQELRNVSMLLDASGGQGIDTPIQVPSKPIMYFPHPKVGYAGGINENNVAEKLSYLMENDEVGDFWIDMESGVRTDDWFDLDKVRRVLEICEPIINKYK